MTRVEEIIADMRRNPHSIRFRDLCLVTGVRVEKSVALNPWGAPLRLNAPWWFWNLFGEQAVFLLSRKG